MKLALIAFLSLLSAAFAATPVEMLDQLRAELRTELRSALDKGNGENNQRLFQIESLLIEQLPAGELPEAQFSSTIQILGQLRSLTRVAKTEELCQNLILELRTLATARDKKFKETFSATVKEALITGLKARTPKEVDAPLTALANLQKQMSQMERHNNGNRSVDTQSLSTVTSVLTLWQDSMLPRIGPQRSRNSIEQLESMTQSYAQQFGDLMPRSEFVTLVAEARSRLDPALAKKAPSYNEVNRLSIELLRSVQRLEDIADAQKAMQALSADSESNPVNTSTAAQMLNKIHRFHEDLKAGVAVSFSMLDPISNGPDAAEYATLRALLIKKALPRVLKLEGEALPREEENATAYLGRMIAESQKKSDWPLLARALDSAQSLQLTGLVTTSDSAAFRMLLAGLNQERAQVYSGAVASYLAALRSGSQILQSELIGQKIEAIRKGHPEDYEVGLTLPILEPTFSRPGGYPYSVTARGTPGSSSVSASISVGKPAPLVVPAVPKPDTTPKAAPVPAQEKKPPEPAKPEPSTGRANP